MSRPTRHPTPADDPGGALARARALGDPTRSTIHHLVAAVARHAKRPTAGLRRIAGQGETVKPHQFIRVLGLAMALEVVRRGHAQAAVVRQAHADEAGVGEFADAHGEVVAVLDQITEVIVQTKEFHNTIKRYDRIANTVYFTYINNLKLEKNFSHTRTLGRIFIETVLHQRTILRWYFEIYI